MSKSIKVNRVFSKEGLKVGDKVRVIDGSSLTSFKTKRGVSIIETYEELTGINETLGSLIGTVTRVGVKDRIEQEHNFDAYYQDLVIKIGSGKFRTASGMVAKLSGDEIKTSILKLAKEKGYSKGVSFRSVITECTSSSIHTIDEIYYDDLNGRVYSNSGYIYAGGKWAAIIEDKKFKAGDKFKSSGSGDTYILSNSGGKNYCLISLSSGRRYSEPIETESHSITLEELAIMKGGSKNFNLTKIN